MARNDAKPVGRLTSKPREDKGAYADRAPYPHATKPAPNPTPAPKRH